MTKRRIIRLVVIAAAAIAVAYVEYQRTPSAQTTGSASGTAHGEAIGDISVTKHGRCRMECRHVRMSEVREVIAQGNINRRKSNRDAKPCPVNAYEGRTSDGQRARIVVAECATTRKIVTVIDLERKYDCACP